MKATRSAATERPRGHLPCVIEQLEARLLMSAAHGHAAPAPAPTHHVVSTAHHHVHLTKAPAPARHPVSAAHHHVHLAKAPAPARHPVSAARGKTNVAASPASAPATQVVSAPDSIYPDCLGTWSIAANSNTSPGTVYNFTATFTRQKGVSLTGTFNMSSLIGGNVLTTATIGQSPSFIVMVQGPTATASFIGALAANGKYINGRWSVLSNKGVWIVGTFTMTRP